MIKTVGKIAGNTIQEAVLQVENQRIAILNYGCIIRRWQIADASLSNAEHARDLILGFDTLEGYSNRSRHFGTVAGRVANRTHLGQFHLQDQRHQLSVNDGAHHLHGGCIGLGQRVWSMEADSAQQRVRLTYDSPQGEEGYPGAVAFVVDFQLTTRGLLCEMHGMPDSPTPVNLAQHNYYNLDGAGDALDHTLTLQADHYLPVDSDLIPQGSVAPVADTRFDFRQPLSLRSADPERLGVDHTLVLGDQRDQSAPAASLCSSDGRVALDVVTDQPGIQVFTAAALSIPEAGIGGRKFGPYAGVCLEAQGFPDALNNPQFPSIICSPENPYRQSLKLNVSING